MPLWVVLLIIIGLLLVIIAVMQASSVATRLHRLYIRTDEARISMEAALERRSAVVSAVCPELAAEASAAQAIPITQRGGADRAVAEQNLEEKIPSSESSEGQNLNAAQLAALADAQARVELAVRFYNEAVLDTRNLRLRPTVRFFHLGGHAPVPEYFEAAGIETVLDKQ